MRGAPFELRVWAALRLIPPGQTVSYGEIARQIGAPGSSRAVGMANGANPIAIIVPCHRVIGSNGTLTGYGGGLDRKAWLLNHERGSAAGAHGECGRINNEPAEKERSLLVFLRFSVLRVIRSLRSLAEEPPQPTKRLPGD